MLQTHGVVDYGPSAVTAFGWRVDCGITRGGWGPFPYAFPKCLCEHLVGVLLLLPKVLKRVSNR
jgi:hypothetical protein